MLTFASSLSYSHSLVLSAIPPLALLRALSSLHSLELHNMDLPSPSKFDEAGIAIPGRQGEYLDPRTLSTTPGGSIYGTTPGGKAMPRGRRAGSCDPCATVPERLRLRQMSDVRQAPRSSTTATS